MQSSSGEMSVTKMEHPERDEKKGLNAWLSKHSNESDFDTVA